MLRIIIESLLCGLPIILIFLSLYQISSWEIGLFRWGIIILEFSEPFSNKIPEHLTNKIIEHKGITFKFVSQKLGLFQAKIKRRSLESDHISGSGGFPLLGEIILGKAGVAKIILRIPFYIVFLYICALIAIFGLNILSKDNIFDLSGTIMGTLLFSALISFWAFVEKEYLRNGFQKIKEYISENS